MKAIIQTILLISIILSKSMAQSRLDKALNLLRNNDLITKREEKLVREHISKLNKYRKQHGYDTEDEEETNYSLNYEIMGLLAEAKKYSTSGTFSALSFTPAPKETRKMTEEDIYKEIKQFIDKIERSGLTSNKTIKELNKTNEQHKIAWQLEVANYAFEKTNEEYFLQPTHFQKLVQGLLTSGIIDEESFTALSKKSESGELKRYREIYPYLKYFTIFELNDMPVNGDNFLSELYKKTAAVFPGLQFDSLIYKDVIDKKESFDNFIAHNLSVTLFAGNKKYSFSSYYAYEDPQKSKENKSDEDNFIEDTRKIPEQYYQIFNKILVDTLSAFRLHKVNISHDIFGIIALTEKQTKSINWTYDGAITNYIDAGYENYSRKLTSKKIKEAIQVYDSLGLFKHLTKEEKDNCQQELLTKEINYYTDILKGFDKVVFDIDAEYGVDDAQYKRITENLSEYSRGYFNPVYIIDGYKFENKKFEYGFTLNGKQYKTILTQEDDWLDMNFWELIQTALKDQDKGGNFYYVHPSDGITAIYLTNEQYTLLKEKRLIEFSYEEINE
ncbi:hypothetical protein BH10BAC2_BH10BAC2_26710 [soil metagenome]